jgi:hypothetical protein
VAEHFIIYCDESTEKGSYFSHFYGGVLVRADDRAALEQEIAEKKAKLQFNGEVKWTKITENYADKYIELVDFIFDLIAAGRLKMRIMFTQNIYVPTMLEHYHVENEYFILYYHFIKNAFGLKYWSPNGPRRLARFAVYIDDPPAHPEKFERFRQYIASLSRDYVLAGAGIRISKEDVTKIRFHEHNILQCLDVILGGIQSKLNEQHTRAEPGKRRKSKRAKAKTRVYQRIKDRLFELRPNFNVGTSTGTDDYTERWSHSYRHWKFVPTRHIVDRSKGKNG